MGLSKRKIELLREFVDYICEFCHFKEGKKDKDGDIVGILQPHKLKRGCEGGTYEHRNIKMGCPKCHDLIWP